MSRRNWGQYRPGSLQDAIEACVEFARERHQMSVDRIADEMGLASRWTLYKYIQSASIPARLIRPFESACHCTYITQHLAASARKLLIDIPSGRKVGASGIQAVQAACTQAIGALLDFSVGKSNAVATVAMVTEAIERLARERAEVERHAQPELALT